MKKVIYALLSFAPVLALAQTTGTAPSFTNLTTFIGSLKTLLNTLIPLIFVIALIYFLWGIVQYLQTSGKDPKAHEVARSHMIYGIIALAVMATVFGLINWLAGTAGLTSNSITLPSVTNIQ